MIRLAVAVALVAAACGTGSSDVEAPPLVTVAVDSAPVTLEQVDCPREIASPHTACGSVEVPLDRDDPASGTTVITVAVLAGSDAAYAIPAAVLQGGPGGASTELAGWFPRQPFTQVFIDQRGTGFTGPDLDCTELDDRLDEVLTLGSDDGNALALDLYRQCADRLAGDATARSATTANHAFDVADVMRALGHESWVAYGVSYGSTIGLELLRDAPEGLAGVVLDGVYPPELDVDAGVAFSADRAVAEVDAACAADAECRSWTDDVAGLLDELIERLDADPIEVELEASEVGTADDLTVVLDGGRLAEFAFLLLYSESRLRFLPGVLAGLDDGDDAAAEWIARTGARALIASQAANDEGVYFSVQCHDRLPFTDEAAPDRSAFAAAVVSVSLHETCAAWDREPAPASAGEPVEADLPTLLLSGRFDPITPAPYAESVAARLGAAVVVEQDGRGHGIWYGDDCIAVDRGRSSWRAPDGTISTRARAAGRGPEIDWARP